MSRQFKDEKKDPIKLISIENMKNELRKYKKKKKDLSFGEQALAKGIYDQPEM